MDTDKLYDELSTIQSQVVASGDFDHAEVLASIQVLIDKLKQDPNLSKAHSGCLGLLVTSKAQIEDEAFSPARTALGTAMLVAKGGGPNPNPR